MGCKSPRTFNFQHQVSPISTVNLSCLPHIPATTSINPAPCLIHIIFAPCQSSHAEAARRPRRGFRRAEQGQDRRRPQQVSSNTGQGVHLYFDPERSLSPDPDQAAKHQCTDSTEGVVVIDGSDSGDSSSDLGSDSETVAPDTPSPRGQVWPSSHPDSPKAPRYIKQENRPEGSVDSSSSVHDSLAPIAERKKALKAHLDGDVEGRRRFLEHEHQNIRKNLGCYRDASGN
jgi:hypothetical protein